MSQNLTYITVFKTNFVDEKFAKVVVHPVKIEFFTGPRSYQIPVQVAHKFSSYEEQLVARTRILQLDDEFHIEIKVRTREKDATHARRFCEARVDESISLLSAIYNFHIFDELIYKGWVIENEMGVLGGWVQIIDEPKFTVDANELSTLVERAKNRIASDEDMTNRFTLMARFLSKSIFYDLSEEKFILLWTALEIFPMKNTSNIEPINSCLAEILQADIQSVKNKLEIGKLYGLRCMLVHDGKFDLDLETMNVNQDKSRDIRYEHHQSRTIAKLEYIVREIMRYMCGMSYSGTLDQYL